MTRYMAIGKKLFSTPTTVEFVTLHSTSSADRTCWQRPLRPSNVDPASGGLEELQRVIGLIRSRWSQTQILVRGDSAYARFGHYELV